MGSGGIGRAAAAPLHARRSFDQEAVVGQVKYAGDELRFTEFTGEATHFFRAYVYFIRRAVDQIVFGEGNATAVGRPIGPVAPIQNALLVKGCGQIVDLRILGRGGRRCHQRQGGGQQRRAQKLSSNAGFPALDKVRHVQAP